MANDGPGSAEKAPFFRRIPRQARSRQLVERILNATVVLLQREGIAALSTNRVAAEAGVDIASVYQYFSSKEAILYALTEQWLAKVQAVYTALKPQVEAGMPLVTLLRQFYAAMLTVPENEWGYEQLAALMETIPELRALESAHETATAAFWTHALRHYGARWDDDKLGAFVRLLYVQMDSALSLAGRLPAAHRRQVQHWAKVQMVRQLRLCLPDLRTR